MPIIIGDYLGDTQHLTTEQHGAYFLLMMHQWRRGIIPETTGEMAAISRCTPTHFKRHIAPAIGQFFTRVEGGFIIKRITEERAEATHRSKTAAENVGKRHARNRANNRAVSSDNNEIADTAVIRNGYSSPSPSPEEEKEGRDTPYPSSEAAHPTPEQIELLPSATIHKLPDQNHIAVLEWNKVAEETGLASVRWPINPTRLKHLKARLKEAGGIEGWRLAVNEVRTCDKLNGKAATDRFTWVADFDFLLQPSSFARVIEGTYRNRAAATAKRGHSFNAAQEMIIKAEGVPDWLMASGD